MVGDSATVPPRRNSNIKISSFRIRSCFCRGANVLGLPGRHQGGVLRGIGRTPYQRSEQVWRPDG